MCLITHIGPYENIFSLSWLRYGEIKKKKYRDSWLRPSGPLKLRSDTLKRRRVTTLELKGHDPSNATFRDVSRRFERAKPRSSGVSGTGLPKNIIAELSLAIPTHTPN